MGLTLPERSELRRKSVPANEESNNLSSSKLPLGLWQLQGRQIDLHAEAIKFRRLRLGASQTEISSNAWVRAAEQRRRMPFDPRPWSKPHRQMSGSTGTTASAGLTQPQVAGIQPSSWTWLGPGSIGGRIRSILVHPTVSGTMWVGGVGGGVWKTINSGTTWFPLDDFMANLAVSCMAMAPTDPNTLYAGTGEGFQNLDAIRGAGIFKSTDGGTNWSQLPATTAASFHFVNRLAINPANSQIILAATGSGIFRSVDGGTNWNQSTNAETLDIHFHPTNGGLAVAGGRNGKAFFSIDGGLTWSNAAGLPSITFPWYGGRVELAYSPSSPVTVYATVDNNSGTLYRSTDGGHTYSLQNTGLNYLSDQGWYDNSIWVDPTDPNTLIVGGLDLWRSRDGGTTFTRISQWQNAPSSAHADQHAIVSSPGFNGANNTTVFFGNDGGIYQAAKVYTVSTLSGWTELNHHLGITEFYGAAGNAASGTAIGGSQDNGTLRYTPAGGIENWPAMFGGDGGFCAADPTDQNYFYGEYVFLNIHRSTDGAASADYISGQYWNGVQWAWKSDPYRIPDAQSGNANFIAPFILDVNQPNRILAGGLSLWRSNNAKAPNTTSTGPAWASIKPPIPSNSYISALAVAPGNSDILWVGYDDGSVYASANGTAATPAWTRVDLGTPNLPKRYCTRITVDPSNPAQAYVTFSGFSAGNVWRTSDSGVTWTDLSAGLPAAPVYCLLISPADSKSIYLGTEVGVFATTDGGTTWSPNNDGPANVVVEELFWMGNNLMAATHGRGLFSIPVTTMPPVLTWTAAAGDGNWFNRTNWSPMAVPTAADLVVLNSFSLNVPTTAQFAVLNFIGGSLSGTFTNSTTINWTGGTFNGQLANAPGGILNISGGGAKTVAGGSSILNGGTIFWSGMGNLVDANSSPGSSLNNLAGGILEIQSDAVITVAGLGGTPMTITNTGTLRKTGGTNTTSLGLGAFVNAGTADVQSGTLHFGSGYLQTAPGTLKLELRGSVPGRQYGRLIIDGAASLGGTLRVDLLNSFVPSFGDAFQILTYSSASGLFTTNNAGHLGLVPFYSATNLYLGCTNISGLVAVWVATNFPSVPVDQHGLLDTPFGDGIPNLRKYALGADPGNPTDRSQEAIPSSVRQDGSTFMTLTFKKRNDPGLDYFPEVSADKLSWSSDAGHLQVVSQSAIDSEFHLVIAQDLTPITPNAPRFMRLRISAPGD